jgi:hypothetical protein
MVMSAQLALEIKKGILHAPQRVNRSKLHPKARAALEEAEKKKRERAEKQAAKKREATTLIKEYGPITAYISSSIRRYLSSPAREWLFGEPELTKSIALQPIAHFLNSNPRFLWTLLTKYEYNPKHLLFLKGPKESTLPISKKVDAKIATFLADLFENRTCQSKEARNMAGNLLLSFMQAGVRGRDAMAMLLKLNVDPKIMLSAAFYARHESYNCFVDCQELLVELVDRTAAALGPSALPLVFWGMDSSNGYSDREVSFKTLSKIKMSLINQYQDAKAGEAFDDALIDELSNPDNAGLAAAELGKHGDLKVAKRLVAFMSKNYDRKLPSKSWGNVAAANALKQILKRHAKKLDGNFLRNITGHPSDPLKALGLSITLPKMRGKFGYLFHIASGLRGGPRAQYASLKELDAYMRSINTSFCPLAIRAADPKKIRQRFNSLFDIPGRDLIKRIEMIRERGIKGMGTKHLSKTKKLAQNILNELAGIRAVSHMQLILLLHQQNHRASKSLEGKIKECELDAKKRYSMQKALAGYKKCISKQKLDDANNLNDVAMRERHLRECSTEHKKRLAARRQNLRKALDKCDKITKDKIDFGQIVWGARSSYSSFVKQFGNSRVGIQPKISFRCLRPLFERSRASFAMILRNLLAHKELGLLEAIVHKYKYNIRNNFIANTIYNYSRTHSVSAKALGLVGTMAISIPIREKIFRSLLARRAWTQAIRVSDGIFNMDSRVEAHARKALAKILANYKRTHYVPPKVLRKLPQLKKPVKKRTGGI